MKTAFKKSLFRLGFLLRIFLRALLSWKLMRIRKRVRKKQRIKVVMLPILESVWKYGPVYEELLKNEIFDVEIAVLPLVENGNVDFEQYQMTCAYFSEQEYKVRTLYNSKKKSWASLSTLEADVLLFCDCWPLSFRKYYYSAFIRYLCCYVPYSHQVSKYDNYQAQYNKLFHNCMWKIFAPHKHEIDIFKSHSITRTDNVEVTGYPGCASLHKEARKIVSVAWPKATGDKKRIIWAPHHSILWKVRRYSNFLDMHDVMQDLAKKYSDKIQVCFKPHPMLRSTLYEFEPWGRDRTDQYYDFWKNHSHHILNDGDYIELFNSSDALVHDSGSFLAEYLYVDKPVLFLKSSNDIEDSFNPFGKLCLNASYSSHSVEDVEDFINDVVIGGNDFKKRDRSGLWDDHLSLSYGAAQSIVNMIETEANATNK